MVPSAYGRRLSLPTAVRSRDSSDDNRSGSTAGNPPLERRCTKFGDADTLLIIKEIMVEAAGVEPFTPIENTELVENSDSHKTQKVLKWAVYYTRITRGPLERDPRRIARERDAPLQSPQFRGNRQSL